MCKISIPINFTILPGLQHTRKKAAKTMRFTVKELTRFNTIAIYNGDHIITIDMLHNEVFINAPGNVCPVVKMTFNKSDVLKFNKKSISTCNIEFLTYVLANNETIYNNVYGFIKYHSTLFDNDITTCNECSRITKAAFYNSFNDNINAFVEFFKSCSSSTKQTIIYDHIVFNHDAKMHGVISLSTYVGNNKYCLARCDNCSNAICKYCYASSLTKQRYFLKMKLIRIMAIFTSVELKACDVPVIDAAVFPFFRFEAFGDLNNKLQFVNYNLFARVNSAVNITIWTKNPGIIQACINDGLQFSKNLVIGLSSLYLNTPEIEKAKKYSFIRFLFTVYDDNYIKEHNIVINCGAKHCLTCGICYKHLHEYKNAGLMIINEGKK